MKEIHGKGNGKVGPTTFWIWPTFSKISESSYLQTSKRLGLHLLRTSSSSAMGRLLGLLLPKELYPMDSRRDVMGQPLKRLQQEQWRRLMGDKLAGDQPFMTLRTRFRLMN